MTNPEISEKQKSQYLNAVKSSFLLSALHSINENILGKNTLIWSRLNEEEYVKKFNETFENKFLEHLENISHDDYEHVVKNASEKHDKLVEKTIEHFKKIVDTHGKELNKSILIKEMSTLDTLHHI